MGTPRNEEMTLPQEDSVHATLRTRVQRHKLAHIVRQ
eukprot:CAMPEP_0174913066 /NCGR_PEP_ID=MMETSP0167-20121228/80119_1 /TAXON_ID=38298 /ORGANISM="Rhodella maculata, Strain CCMP736" /LENGTH=36 /DNA_ID= /DNA_START= /DNA_END= /DNA_ORIENTATION=